MTRPARASDSRTASVGRRVVLLLGGISYCAAPACIVTEGPIEIRYFEPAEVASPDDDGSPSARRELPTIDLDYESAAPHLDLKMAWKVSRTEWVFDESNRWIALPARLARNELERTLFESAGFVPARSDAEVRLVVTLERFERDPDEAIVAFRVERHGPGGIDAIRRVEGREPVADDTPSAYARAMGHALARACAGIVAMLDGSRANGGGDGGDEGDDEGAAGSDASGDG